MRAVVVAALVSLAALAGVGPGAAAAPVTAKHAGATVDWTAGRLVASGSAAADPRAPDAEVARVTAERVALERARAALDAAARALPLADGGTVGERAKADAAVETRLVAAVARARRVAVSYASDGGARVSAALPLEAVRLAVTPAAPTRADEAAPTAIVIDGTAVGLTPVLGFGVVGGPGGGLLAGPTVWVDSAAAAAADPRVGPRVVPAQVTRVQSGRVLLDLPAADLERAAAAGALIVVVTAAKGSK